MMNDKLNVKNTWSGLSKIEDLLTLLKIGQFHQHALHKTEPSLFEVDKKKAFEIN